MVIIYFAFISQFSERVLYFTGPCDSYHCVSAFKATIDNGEVELSENRSSTSFKYGTRDGEILHSLRVKKIGYYIIDSAPFKNRKIYRIVSVGTPSPYPKTEALYSDVSKMSGEDLISFVESQEFVKRYLNYDLLQSIPILVLYALITAPLILHSWYRRKKIKFTTQAEPKGLYPHAETPTSSAFSTWISWFLLLAILATPIIWPTSLISADIILLALPVILIVGALFGIHGALKVRAYKRENISVKVVAKIWLPFVLNLSLFILVSSYLIVFSGWTR